MLTLKCTIKFADGKTLTATASAETPYDDVTVSYAGEVERRPERPSGCPIMFVRYSLQCLAEKSGAEFTEEFEGRFVAEH